MFFVVHCSNILWDLNSKMWIATILCWCEDFVYNLPVDLTTQWKLRNDKCSQHYTLLTALRMEGHTSHGESWMSSHQLHSLHCVCAKCHFHSHCRFLPVSVDDVNQGILLKWYHLMLLSAVSVHCHIGEIVSFSLFFFLFFTRGVDGGQPRTKIFYFFRTFPQLVL